MSKGPCLCETAFEPLGAVELCIGTSTGEYRESTVKERGTLCED